MPTKERLRARAAADTAELDLSLSEAAERASYATESLRKMMWGKNPPPLRKARGGRWRANSVELDAWIAERDGEFA